MIPIVAIRRYRRCHIFMMGMYYIEMVSLDLLYSYRGGDKIKWSNET